MDDLARNLDALKLAERLHGITEEQLWVHVEAEGPLEKYPAKQHARRVRDRLDVAEGLVYLPGVLAKNNEDSDMPAPFRQRRYFYYLSGCNEAGCHLTYDIKRDLLTLFIPRIDPDRVFWNGRGSTPAEALDKYDIDQVLFADQLESWIHEWFSHYRYDGSQRLYVLHREQIPPHSRSPWPVNITSLRPAMDQCRMIKDDHEIKLIRKANDISSEAHRQVLANITKFTNEAQVEGRFLDVCISNQAKQQAYDPIAASGPNAGTLHYGANNEDFGDRQLICLDAGCEFDLYASDITRTFPFSGSWPSKEAENIYKLVEQMQETCIQRLAPGVRYLDLHILAHQIAIDGLLKLGILHNGTREEIYKAGTSRAFFPHGLGHHVGLEVHDVGQRELMSLYKHPKYGKVPSLYPEDFHLPVYDEGLCMAPTLPESPHLDEGMVVTVEPGIYFSAYALNYFYFPSPIHSKYINKEVLARYFPVGGVRIEDDLLITSKGYENLTTAPKGEDMLKIINGQNSRSTPISTQQRADNADESLRRAPGIPKHILDPLLKPIRRASTEPVQPSRPVPDENSAFQNHWLFRESRSPPLSADNNEKRRISKTEKRSVATSENQLSLCGSVSPDFEHMVMGWQNETKQKTHSLYLGIGMKLKPKGRCPQCVVLSETIERLRKTLSRSTETSPKPSPKLDTGNFPLPLVNGQAPSDKKVPEMRQVPTSVPRNSTNDTQSNGSGRGIHAEALRNSHGLPSLSREHDVTRTSWRPTSIHEAVHQVPEQVPLRTHYKVPESIQSGFQRGFGHEPHGQNNINTAYVPQMGTQQGSSTYDGYPNTYSNRLSAGGDEHAIHEPYCPTEVPSRETILNRIERYYRDSATRRSSSLSSGLESKSIPEAGRHNEGSDYRDLTGTLNERQQLRSISFAEPRPSLPNLRNYSTLDMDTRKHVTTSSSQRRSIAAPTASTKQHDLRQRRSVGNSLGSGGVQSQPPMTACTNPVLRNSSKIHNNPWVDGFGTSDSASAYRQERPHRPNDPFPPGAFRGSGHVYAMNRPGGEELGGIDYLNR